MFSYLKNAVTSFIFEDRFDENNIDILKTYSLENSCTSDGTQLESEGEITFISKEFGLIDSKYSFPVTLSNENITVGDRLWYKYIPHPTGENSRRIVKIKLLNNVSDDCEEDFLNANQVIVNIVKREGRKIYFSNDIICDLDQVHVENNYIPEVGDVVKIDMLNEEERMIVHSIQPYQMICKVGVLVKLGKTIGFINDNSIWFHRDSLQSGYEPIVGDNVEFTALKIVEEDDKTWRAFSIRFHSMETEDTNNDLTLKFNKNSLNIGGSTDFGEVCLNRSTSLVLKITNSINEEYNLNAVKFRREQKQIRVDDISLPCVIKPHSVISVKFTCCPTYVGFNSEVVDFCFDNFQISRRFEMIVFCPKEYGNSTFTPYVPKKQTGIRSFIDRSEEKRTYGPYPGKNNFFKRGAKYAVPPNILKVCNSHYEFKKDELLAWFEACPILQKELQYSTYAEKFHTLQFIEQMYVQKHLLRLSKSHVFFRRNGEYLVLDMPGASEQRPSLIIGDKVVVTQPWSERDKTAHVGFIHFVGRDTISVLFHESFHNSYNQTDCDVSFENGSMCHYLHDGIKRAVLNLKDGILFPTALAPKKPRCHIKEHNLNLYNKTLNQGQRAAVVNILSAECRPLPHIVFGPPGTGKTVTIVESVLQIVRCLATSRVLVTAPSNSAADLLASMIIKSGNLQPGQLLRVYAYSRQQESIPEELLPFAMTGHDDDNDGGASKDLMIGWHRITVGTCTSISFLHLLGLPHGHFTHIIMDEAGYATEPQILVPLTLLDPLSGVAVVAGDPKQLGPVVISSLASKMGLGQSYLSRIIERFPYVRDNNSFPNSHGYDPRIVTKLTLNYRSVPEILALPSKLFYNNELKATVSPVHGRESEIIAAFNAEKNICEKPVSILFHGIRGQSMQEDDSPSWFNPHELFHVVQYIRIFYKIGIDPSEIGVITPYRKQVMEIKKFLTALELELPKIGSVEEFQGQERQVVIMSCVRSQYKYINDDKKFSLGFIANPKRINVAITRARSLLIILGNPHLLSFDPYWRSVIYYCLKLDAYIGCDVPNNLEKIMLEGNIDKNDEEIQLQILDTESKQAVEKANLGTKIKKTIEVEAESEPVLQDNSNNLSNMFPVVTESHLKVNADLIGEW